MQTPSNSSACCFCLCILTAPQARLSTEVTLVLLKHVRHVPPLLKTLLWLLRGKPKCSPPYSPVLIWPPVTSLSSSPSLSSTHPVLAILTTLLLPKQARPQGLCLTSLEALLLDTCLANSVTSYRSWLKAHLLSEASHHLLIYYCIAPPPIFELSFPLTWFCISIFLSYSLLIHKMLSLSH